MSLMEELKIRGIKVADLAAHISESYGNTYTALKMDRDGKETNHKSVHARLEKIRKYLGEEKRQDERLATGISGSRNRRLDKIHRKRPVPEGRVGVYELTVGGVEVVVGSKIFLSNFYATEILSSGVYTFLRATALLDGTIVDVDLYGGPGSGDKQFATHRTIRPEAIGFPKKLEEPDEVA